MIDTHTAIIGTNEAGTIGIDLDALIGSHLCVSANSGGGKSGAIRKLLEATHGHVQHIILDAEDEFYTLRERFDYVIAGGEEGDAPATIGNAAALADAALANGFSLIAQINDLGDDAGEFIAAFLKALIAAPRHLWRPLLIVIDEAQRFAPTNGASPAAKTIKDLMQRGRKRGFTAVVASTKFSELDASVRGQCRNWMLGLVGQALDRRTVADQMGFAPSSAEAKGLQRLEPRTFWGFGPAISREPVLFRIDDAETTIVKAGQAHVPTPPAPDALREILAALAAVPSDDIAAPSAGASEAGDAEVAQLRERIAVLEGDLRAIEGMADAAYERGKIAGISIGITRARSAIDALRIPDIASSASAAAIPHQDGGHHVDRSAGARPVDQEPPVPAKGKGHRGSDRDSTSTSVAAGGSPSPAALAIADLLDRINPARVTWAQAAAMTGRKATGGNFNAARKWLRGSGRLVEDGDLIRSSADAPAGMTREEAITLWKGVLTSPAPKMIDAFLLHGNLTKEQLGGAIGAQPRGGNFNNGLAQLRRNGLIYEYGSGTLRLAEPLPGEAE